MPGGLAEALGPLRGLFWVQAQLLLAVFVLGAVWDIAEVATAAQVSTAC